MRKTRRSKKPQLKGGKVLGEGADGCVLTDPIWPCALDIPGYDPSDRTLVGKIVENSDIEDINIRIAKNIVGESPHIIQLIGVCKLDNPDTTDRVKAKYIFDNRRALTRLFQNSYMNSHKKACTRLGQIPVEKIIQDYKILILKRYDSDLLTFFNDNYTTANFTKELLISAIPFVKVLQQLVDGNTGKLINLDLHAQNIFIHGSHMGMADLGRCVYWTPGNSENWLPAIRAYLKKYPVFGGFPHIPIEARLYSFFVRQKTPINISSLLHDFVYKQLEGGQLKNNTTDPLLFCSDPTFFVNFLESELRYFIYYMYQKDDATQNKLLKFIGGRFINLGFLSQLIHLISYSPDFIGEFEDIKNAVIRYMVSSGRINQFTDSINMRLVKFYYDTLLAPHAIVENELRPTIFLEKMDAFDFPQKFETNFKRMVLRLQVPRMTQTQIPRSPTYNSQGNTVMQNALFR